MALIGTGRTAEAILSEAALEAGDVVLLPGAAGGLGILLAQAAAAAGATVVGLAGGPAKTARVQADAVIDYLEPGWEERVPAGDRAARRDRRRDRAGAVRPDCRRRAGGAVRLVVRAAVRFDVWDLFRLGVTVSCAIGARIATWPGGMRRWRRPRWRVPGCRP